MISEKEYNIIIGKILVNHATETEIREVFSVIKRMEDILDSGDMNDAFGTEGWRHYFCWD